VGAGGGDAANNLPGDAQKAEPGGAQLVLQPGEQHVLFVAHVLSQHGGQPVEEDLSLAAIAGTLEAADQLVDLLVLLLDLQRQSVSVGEYPPDDRPQDRLLSERVWEGQAADAHQHLVLLGAGAAV
jgi:hypothetical protein